ncbi:MAG: hypothetical protein M3256_12075, partial [Actinomycetota bacterium]|nr:hypothetical protein [Actinomycetota bacterium]
MAVGDPVRAGTAGCQHGDDAVAEQYRGQQRRDARDTTLVGGLVALVAFPAWAVFDRLELPARAGTFLVVRLLAEVVLMLSVAALGSRRLGERWPEQLSLLIVAIPEVAIAWMIPRSGTQLEAYLLGLSLPIYATAFLLAWRWRMTVVLVGCT